MMEKLLLTETLAHYSNADPNSALCRRLSECAPAGSHESSALLVGAGRAARLAFKMSNRENTEKDKVMTGKRPNTETQTVIGGMT